MRKLFLTALLLISGTLLAQYTSIPDVNFEKALIELQLDSGTPDGKVLTSNIKNVKSLNVGGKNIIDLTGIEGFTALESLYCYNNKLTTINISNNLNLSYFNSTDNELAQLDVSKNVALTYLDCSANKLTSLKVSNNTLLTDLYCTTNLIEQLDVSNNKALKKLRCYHNKISTLNLKNNLELTVLSCGTNTLNDIDVSMNTKLVEFDCEYAYLKYLDVSNNKLLKVLRCRTNKLTYLDISNNLMLETLFCSQNDLVTLDVSKHLELIRLFCDTNRLSTLDLSNNKKIIELMCYSNSLQSLNLKNGSNSLLKSPLLKFNPELKCVLVDDVNYATTNWIDKDNVTIYSTTSCEPVKITIPDSAFEQALIDAGVDTDGKNGYVLYDAIKNIQSLDVSNKQITSLTGIEYFHALNKLNCSKNNLKTLDLTKNSFLKQLDCSYNLLFILDLVLNKNLSALNASNNLLKILEVNNGNNANLISPNFTNNPKLECIAVDNIVFANKNWSTYKDAFAQYATTSCEFKVKINDIAFEEALIKNKIDTDGKNGYVLYSSIRNISDLSVGSANISSLEGIQYFTNLRSLNCLRNNLLALDVSLNSNLTFLNCEGNKLLLLNVKNGRNKSFYLMYAKGNSNLKCITVDDVDFANKNWSTSKEVSTTFSSTVCDVPVIKIPDSAFEDALIKEGIDTNGKNNTVLLTSVLAVENLYIQNKNIKDLTGIEYFVNLKSLMCGFNQINRLYLDNNKNLRELECGKNQLIYLDTRNNKQLFSINCTSNQITDLYLDNNQLLNLYVADNKLNSLDISKMPLLSTLYCSENKLVYLNLKNGNNTKLKTIDFKGNPLLYCIEVDDVNYANTNWGFFKDSSATYNTNCTILEEDIFKISTQGETCVNAKNGSVTITNTNAKKKFTYVVYLGNREYEFTDTLTINTLTPDNYIIRVAVKGTGFYQRFQFTIPAGVEVSGKSNLVNKELLINVATGTPPFTVSVNGRVLYDTYDESFKVPVIEGDEVVVSTARACQGELKTVVPTTASMVAHPNPTKGVFVIHTTYSEPFVPVTLYNAAGIVVNTANYVNLNGTIEGNLQEYANGVYFVKIGNDNPQVIKVVKY